MARPSLDADSPYIDIAMHGNGMTALQFRDEKSASRAKCSGGVSAEASKN